MAKSIITKDMDRCFLCGSTNNIETHHVFFGVANRKLADKHGLTVPLCAMHHRGNCGVHQDRQLDLMLKEVGQIRFEENNTREEFMKLFGRNYLD